MKNANQPRRTKRKCSKSRPLRIGSVIVRPSREVTLTIIGDAEVKRLPICGIDASEKEG